MSTTEMRKERVIKRKSSTPEAEDLLEFFEKKKRRQEEEEDQKRVPKREPGEEVLRAMEKLFGSEFTEPVWLGEKKLTKTDVHPHHQRFFFPQTMIEKLKPHLKAWEKGEIEPKDGAGIPVTIVDTLCGDWELRLKRWASLQQFALLQGWKPLVKVNELKDEDRLGVWAYRHGPLHKLGFILRRLH
ncbi:hypothetical protein H6P81_014342 [Aristolochia fimbriata]|uniref:TF-B3 domain-containing protein n=1 Tax=Aristolochia fimbriata TaxID=158543 RepID=A0AAV7EHL0_ARIFI|nr:hypothetical protein H6P81_014342 [Aristolochia fimbriata]